MKEITCKELKQMMEDSSTNFQLIDVREPHEAEIASIGAELLPMGEVMENLDRISKDKKVIVHCRSGSRSGAIVKALEQQGYTNVYNLKGGILAWADEIDHSLTKY
jgi:adenylyltransferase/sulfurtransferase